MKKIRITIPLIVLLWVGSVSGAKQSKVEKTIKGRQPTNVLQTLVTWQTLFGQEFWKEVFGRAGGTYYWGSNDYDLEAIFSHLPRYKDESVFYEAWLYNSKENNYISIGTSLGQPTLKRTDSRINFSTKWDLTNYDIFVMSLESVQKNTSPTTKVIEWEIALRILDDEVRFWAERVRPTKNTVQATIIPSISSSQKQRIESILSRVSRSKLLILKAKIDRLKGSQKIDTLSDSTVAVLDFIEDTVERLLEK